MTTTVCKWSNYEHQQTMPCWKTGGNVSSSLPRRKKIHFENIPMYVE